MRLVRATMQEDVRRPIPLLQGSSPSAQDQKSKNDLVWGVNVRSGRLRFAEDDGERDCAEDRVISRAGPSQEGRGIDEKMSANFEYRGTATDTAKARRKVARLGKLRWKCRGG